MRTILPVAVIVLLITASTAGAHWNEGDPHKWLQNPDLNVTGMDVNATAPFIVADDFLCIETGMITDIHIWGSWLNDYLPLGSAGEVSFMLYILSDIPAEQSPTGYSMPGEILWEHNFPPNSYTYRVYADTLLEGWLEPPEEFIFPGDQICWQYNFALSEEDYFHQDGSLEEAMIYWLEVQAFPAEQGAYFGWKTSTPPFNDDVVYAIGNEPDITDRYTLIFPPGHPYVGEPFSMAMVVQGVADPTDFDFGDAPDPSYPTLAASNGASHVVVPGINLGNNIDAEPDGQPDANAYGDDFSGAPDDEDGVFFMEPFSPNEGTDVRVKTSSAGVLDMWFDWTGDGDWDDANEYVFGGVPVFVPGYTDFTVTTPGDAVPGTVSFARVRFSSTGTPTYDGPAADGEVEDYSFLIDEEYPFKWVRYPDITEAGIDVNCCSPYILADDFLCEDPGALVEIHVWGSWVVDYVPFGDAPDAVGFVLSLHADIPADSIAGTHSMPGDVLWTREFAPGEFMCQLWRDQIEEGWMDPPDFYLFPADHQCWHYIFFIPPEEAFIQEGTVDEPVVYWLDVQAMPLDQDAYFGWKTAYKHWNDDAVWTVGAEPYFGPWDELRYVEGPMAGESIDLAFGIVCDIWAGVDDSDAPPEFNLRQNIPNPFNPSTAVVYEVPAQGGHVEIVVFDVAGRRVTTLVDDEMTAGVKMVTWDGTTEEGERLASGIYFCRMKASGVEDEIKMLLMK